MKEILSKLAKGEEDDDFQLVEGALHKITQQGAIIVVPQSKRRDILK